MYEYIVAATSHLKDSKQDAIAEIYRAIHKKKENIDLSRCLKKGARALIILQLKVANESDEKLPAAKQTEGFYFR